uniref:Uncharacterized protein n=1 Tax=Panagrellus redivivus TaxID=6233 RepID=A0A7E4VIC9_PANRE
MDSIFRDATIVLIVGCATLLLLIVCCLLAMVASLTFDCWWHISYCVNIDDDTQQLIDSAFYGKTERRRRRPWIVRLSRGGKDSMATETKSYII